MVARALVLLALAAVACAQVEQSIFSQFFAPPLALAKDEPKPTTTTTTTTEAPPTKEELEVQPLPERSKRSGFGFDRFPGGNDLSWMFHRPRYSDPGWVPDVAARRSWGGASAVARAG